MGAASMARPGRWPAGYIGLPYRVGEFDCAHLVERVEREVFGRAIDLPKDRISDRAREFSRQIGAHLPAFARRSDAPAEGDLVLMVGAGWLDHIGVLVREAGEQWVLHNFIRARSVVLHRVRDLPRHGLTFEGVYTWI